MSARKLKRSALPVLAPCTVVIQQPFMKSKIPTKKLKEAIKKVIQDRQDVINLYLEGKLAEAAGNYLYDHAMYCQHDNHDAMLGQEQWQTVFDFLKIDSKYKDTYVADFIVDYMSDEIEKTKQDIEEVSGSDWDENSMVCEFLRGRYGKGKKVSKG